MSTKSKEKVVRINDILYHHWNPIAVPDLPEDEYFSYAETLAEMDISDARSEFGAMLRVAMYLMQAEVHTMQLRRQLNFDRSVQHVASLVVAELVST